MTIEKQSALKQIGDSRKVRDDQDLRSCLVSNQDLKALLALHPDADLRLHLAHTTEGDLTLVAMAEHPAIPAAAHLYVGASNCPPICPVEPGEH